MHGEPRWTVREKSLMAQRTVVPGQSGRGTSYGGGQGRGRPADLPPTAFRSSRGFGTNPTLRDHPGPAARRRREAEIAVKVPWIPGDRLFRNPCPVQCSKCSVVPDGSCPGAQALLADDAATNEAARPGRWELSARPGVPVPMFDQRGPGAIFHDWLAAGKAAPAPKLTRLEAASAPSVASKPTETARCRRRHCLVREAAMEPPDQDSELT